MARDTTSDFVERAFGIMNRMFPQRVPSPTPTTRTPLLDAAARSLVSNLDRWSQTPGLNRLVGGARPDTLVGEGERFELVLSAGLTARFSAGARLFANDTPLAELAIDPNQELIATILAPAPGLYRLRLEAHGRGGRGAVDLGERGHLHVTGDRPVALVDARIILPPDGSDPDTTELEALRALAEGPFELAYFGIGGRDRYTRILDEVRGRGLPEGAILAHSLAEAELRKLGVEFLPVFAATSVRRLRAKGVPVTTVLTTLPEPERAPWKDGIHVMRPSAAVGYPATDEKRQAEALLASRRELSRLDFQLDQLTDSQRIAGCTVHAELDNGKARERLFEAIDDAKRTIHLQHYIVRESRFTDALVVRLIRAARRGVKVRFMVDALYSDEDVLGSENEAIRSLRAEPGLQVLAVDPIQSASEVKLTDFKRRDHRKLIIIDGALGFVSGRNASDEYYLGFDEVPVHDNTQHDHLPWLDAHVELRGPIVGAVQETFLQTWCDQGGLPPKNRAALLPKLPSDGPHATRLVVHHGFTDTNGLAMYEALFDSAERHVYIVNDFPFVPALEQAIRRAMARGVEVRLLTGNAAARRSDGTFFPAPLHRTLFEYMVKGKLEPLITSGLDAYEYVAPPCDAVVARGGTYRPYVHAKLVSVDGEVATIGSANLDATASYWESEANVVIQDAAFASALETRLRTIIERSFRLELESEYWQRERAKRALVSGLWPTSLYS